MLNIDFRFAHIYTPVSDKDGNRWGRVEDFLNDGRCVKIVWFHRSGFEVYTEHAVREQGIQFWEK